MQISHTSNIKFLIWFYPTGKTPDSYTEQFLYVYYLSFSRYEVGLYLPISVLEIDGCYGNRIYGNYDVNVGANISSFSPGMI